MATIFNSDLETETSAFTTEWDSKAEEGSNTLAVTTTEAEVYSGSNGAICTFDATNNGVYAIKTVADQDEVYLRFMVKVNSSFEADGTTKIISFVELKDATTFVARVGLRGQADTTTFRWYVSFENGAGSTEIKPAGDITLNTWYLVELHWYAGTGANGGCEIKVDGSSLGSEFTGAQSALRVDTIRAGATAIGNMVPTEASEVYWDDFASDDTAWVGAVASGVDITPPLLTTELAIFNPVVTNANEAEAWDMGPFVYTVTGTTTAVNPPSLQTSLQIHNPVVYAVDYPTAIAPNLMTTSLTMFNPTVTTQIPIFNRIAKIFHLIMRG